MTQGTKTFRIIISVLLALTMIISAFFAVVFCLYFSKDPYGIYVAGVSVDRSNQDDIMGDGTVYYDSTNNILTLNNAKIESEDTVVYSMIDLHIELIGENKVVCTNEEYCVGIYAGNYNLNKELALVGDGSLTIEFPNARVDVTGLSAADLTVGADLTVITPDSENRANGIVCASSLVIVNKATVTVNNGVANYSSAVRVRGNALMEEGTALKVSMNPGATGTCRGLTISGDLFLSKDNVVEVFIDDGATDLGECIRVSGLMEIGSGSTVKASAKNAPAIECFGSIEANKDATISAVSDQNDADIFCSGAVVNRGAKIDGEMDAIGGVHDRD